MKITDVCVFLQSLSTPLRTHGGRDAAEELDTLCTAFAPFRELTVADFAELLSRADREFLSDVACQSAAHPQKSRKPIDEAKVQAAVKRVEFLGQHVASEAMDYDKIETEMGELEAILSREEALAVAAQAGAAVSSKTRKDAILGIKRMLRSLKKSYERNSGRELTAEAPTLARSTGELGVSRCTASGCPTRCWAWSIVAMRNGC